MPRNRTLPVRAPAKPGPNGHKRSPGRDSREPEEALARRKRSKYAIPVPLPPYRALRAFAFDPSLSTELENAVINHVTMQVPWESLEPGPVGEYLEVVDVDPASDCCYEPVNMDEPYLLAHAGLEPSEGNPQFHQQMVYAVAMTTIHNFEVALGRTAFWAPRPPEVDENGKEEPHGEYVQRLRIYPHAMREANAYYSPQKHALLFGYFPATASDPAYHLPGGMVFSCLSHDIIAHETTHALLHGMHRRFNEPTNPDVLAFHEAFADVVALFQHFSLPDALRHQIGKTRGDLAAENLLLGLAYEFGRATQSHGALREALGERDANGNWQPKKPDPNAMTTVLEPHARGSLLVGAIFDAFVTIFKARSADLMRIATGGTGVLPAGSLHPDLVNRLAEEAAKSAQHTLTMCIRALDYCPPVDLTFGEYLRALITADYDLVHDDDRGYRIAFIEAFRRRGIYPRDVRSLSVESLLWVKPVLSDFTPYNLPVVQEIKKHMPEWDVTGRGEEIFYRLEKSCEVLRGLLTRIGHGPDRRRLEKLLRLDPARPFTVHSLRPARRVGPDGQFLNDLVIEITQTKPGYFDEAVQKRVDDEWKKTHRLPATPKPDFQFTGGCTLLVDLESSDVRYCVYKNTNSDTRLVRERAFRSSDTGVSLRATYFGGRLEREPFALLHRMARSPEEDTEWLL